MSNIVVTSHIGRDLLQSANSFKTSDVAVWEYIVNSLQYILPGTTPKVVVEILHKKKMIRIIDNGRGMDQEGMNNFFKMHGENIDRQRGQSGRGKFGTGKSAAFGIGKRLRLESVANGLKNIAILDKEEIEASNGGVIPVRHEIVNEETTDANGTVITIEKIFLSKIDTAKIIKKIEKHLQSFRHENPQVLVGDHICKYKEPVTNETHEYSPDERLKKYLGDATLLVRVSQLPLLPEERGIAISCGTGNLVGVEDAGVCAKEMGEYLFGEIDVPALESEIYEMDAFDVSRDLKLRSEHPVVQALTMFIGTHLEEVRKQLVKQKREDSKSQQNQKLKNQADKIAQLLNDDFQLVNEKIMEIRSEKVAVGSFQTESDSQGLNDELDEEDGWVSGVQERGFDLSPSLVPLLG